ncbi:hypothetical protein Tco_0331166, partial [Tanacetum coccineum]
IFGVKSAVTALTERIAELERDNRRLRGTTSVEKLADLRKMPNTRYGASMTHEEVEELVTRRVAEGIEARKATINLEPLNENVDEQEGENGGNGNGGNGGNENRGNGENENGNRNGNHGMNYRGFMPVARECTFQDFLKCKPHNFSGTEGVVGLTRWFEKIETVFNISNCPSKYQVKYATCTLQDSALTWWNSHKRTIGVEAAYAMNWVELMKKRTLDWLTTQRFQELILLCTRMVPDEERQSGKECGPEFITAGNYERKGVCWATTLTAIRGTRDYRTALLKQSGGSSWEISRYLFIYECGRARTFQDGFGPKLKEIRTVGKPDKRKRMRKHDWTPTGGNETSREEPELTPIGGGGTKP